MIPVLTLKGGGSAALPPQAEGWGGGLSYFPIGKRIPTRPPGPGSIQVIPP